MLTARNSLRTGSIAIAVAAFAATTPAAWSQCAALDTTKLTAWAQDGGSSSQPNDRFGRSVAAWGDFVVIGSPEDDEHASNSGAAYVFRRDGAGWIEHTKLTAGYDAGANEEFGNSVAMWGNTIVVSTRVIEGEPYLSGAAYVFRYDGTAWQREQTLVASDAEEGDHFAFALAIHQDVIVAGALWDDHTGVSGPGSAYVFRYFAGEWVEDVRLGAPAPEHGDAFGYAVATDGDLIVVGARFDDFGDVIEGGSAWVFRRDGDEWLEDGWLTAFDAGDGHRFGSSVSVSADTVLVGAPLNGSGTAYVFRHFDGAWVFEQRLPAQYLGGRFGTAVAVRGNLAVITAPERDPDVPPRGEDGPYNFGAAYAYRFADGIWSRFARLDASDARDQHRLGTSVAIRGNVAFVGTDWADAFAGGVYAFRGLLSDCNGNDARDVCDIAGRSSDDCDRNGLPDECQASVSCLCATDVNADGAIDEIDVEEIIFWWGTDHLYADVDASGTVDIDDLVAIILAWGPCT